MTSLDRSNVFKLIVCATIFCFNLSFASNNSCKAYYQSKNSSISIEESPNYHLFSKKVTALLTWMSNEDLTTISFKTSIMDDLYLHHAIDLGTRRTESIINLISEESPLQASINERVQVFNKRVVDLSAKIQEFKNTDSLKFKLKLVNKETFRLTKLKEIKELFKSLQDDLKFFEEHTSHFKNQSQKIEFYYKQLVDRQKAIEKLAQSVTLYREILLRRSKDFPHLQTKIGIIATSLAQEISSLRSSFLITEKAKQDLDLKQSSTEYMQQSVNLLKNQTIESIFVTQGMTADIANQLLVKLHDFENKKQARLAKRKQTLEKLNQTVVIPAVGITALAASFFGYHEYNNRIDQVKQANYTEVSTEIQNLAPNQEQQRLMKKYENQMPSYFLTAAKFTQSTNQDENIFNELPSIPQTPGEVIYLVNYLPNILNNRNPDGFGLDLTNYFSRIGTNLNRKYTADEITDLKTSLDLFATSLKASAPHVFDSKINPNFVNEKDLNQILETKLVTQSTYFDRLKFKETYRQQFDDNTNMLLNAPRQELTIDQLTHRAEIKVNPTIKTLLNSDSNLQSLAAFSTYLDTGTVTMDDFFYCMLILKEYKGPSNIHDNYAFDFERAVIFKTGRDITKTIYYGNTLNVQYEAQTPDSWNSEIRYALLNKMLKVTAEKINSQEMQFYFSAIDQFGANRHFFKEDYANASRAYLKGLLSAHLEIASE